MRIWGLLLALGCGTSTSEEVEVVPADIGLSECEVCGMVVGEQPAPRGQVLHRDGHRTFTCSLGDLRAYVQAPSPRGQPVGVWVEALSDDFDLGQNATEPLPWVKADEAWFVSGADRPMVMGIPLLSYAEQGHAEAVADDLGTAPLRWAPLEETPFHEVP